MTFVCPSLIIVASRSRTTILPHSPLSNALGSKLTSPCYYTSFTRDNLMTAHVENGMKAACKQADRSGTGMNSR